jgi:Zn-dependent protease with chaperone function
MSGAEGWLYDGTSAIRREVRIARSGDALEIGHADGSAEPIRPERLVHIESRGSTEVYGREDLRGWRLGIVAPGPELLSLLAPKERYGRWIDRVGLVPALVIGVAVSAVVLLAANQAPEWLAPAVPQQWEEKFGDTLVGNFGGKGCLEEEGRAALAKLARRLSPEADKLNIRVVDIPIVNAAALPGGNIVVFDELLKEAQGPDEVAGVLAHEIAHVEERHVTESMIRAFGLGVVVSAFGGNTGANVENLIAAGYSRKAEREADAEAIEALRRANISPLATAAFFERMSKAEPQIRMVSEGLSYLSTHPMSKERREAFRASAVKGRAYPPSLSQAEWEALKDICWVPPEKR